MSEQVDWDNMSPRERKIHICDNVIWLCREDIRRNIETIKEMEKLKREAIEEVFDERES